MTEFNLQAALGVTVCIFLFYFLTRPDAEDTPEKGRINASGLVDINGRPARASRLVRWLFFLGCAFATGIYLHQTVQPHTLLLDDTWPLFGHQVKAFLETIPVAYETAFYVVLLIVLARLFGRLRINFNILYDSIRGAFLLRKAEKFADRIDTEIAKAASFVDGCKLIESLNTELPYGQKINKAAGDFARMGRDALSIINTMPEDAHVLLQYLEGQTTLDDLRQHKILRDDDNVYHPGTELRELKKVLDTYLSMPGVIRKLRIEDLAHTPSAAITKFNKLWTVRMRDSINDFYEALSQYKAGKLGVGSHVDALSDKLTSAKLDELVGKKQGDMVGLYRRIHDAFDRHNLIAPNRLAAIPKDISRIEKIETIIDLYNMKIQSAEQDQSLNEEARARKIQSLQHLMEREIDAMGAST